MKKTVVFASSFVILVSSVSAQHTFVPVNDFETDIGGWRTNTEGVITGWVVNFDETTATEPHHGGNQAAKVEISNSGGWGSSYYQFPEPFDASDADEFRMWVYSDRVFRLRAELGPGLILGFANYAPNDIGTWKELVYWISEEQAELWRDNIAPADELRLIINPSAETVDDVEYPSGFQGTIFIDDMRVRKRIPVEREYLTLIGFNNIDDEWYIRLRGGTYFEVDLSGYPQPTEGEGTLLFDYTSGWTRNIEINLIEFPEFLEYDRIHMDIFVDGSSWATTALILSTSEWLDENGEPHGTAWTQLSETNLGSAVGGWGEISAQYGPVDSEGFQFDWLLPEIAGVYDAGGGRIGISITSQGAAANDGVMAYIDNVRLSRPVPDAIVEEWELR